MDNCPDIIVLDNNRNSREILKSYLEELGFGDDLKLFEDYKTGLEEIKKSSENTVVLIDITDNQAENFKIIEDIKPLVPKIIAASVDYSTNTIVKAMRAGAKEFLHLPVIKEDLRRAVTILARADFSCDESASRIITIYSNKGGIGKTTIAVNLAAEIAGVTGEKTALVDLNLQLGDVSTFLNLNPAFDTGYVIKNLIEKKENSIFKAFERYKNTNLYVLSEPGYIEQSESITPYQIESLFRALKKIFPCIIVDMTASIDPNSLKILDCSDKILFTTIVNIPAIRNAQRCLTLLKSRYYPEGKVKVILNRYMENDEIKLEDMENTIGETIYWKIPNNYFSIMESINRGLTVNEVNSNSNIADSFRDFASKITDDIAEHVLSKFRL